MLPKTARVDRGTFDQTWKRSRSFHCTLATIRYSPGTKFRAACIVSKKVSKSSPDRHRIKRRVYAWFTTHVGQVPAGTYLVYPKKELLRTSHSVLSDQLLLVLSEIIRYVHKSRT